MAVEFQSATPATPPAATSIATDDVGGTQYQLFKLDKGAAGASSPVTDANPLPITVPSLPLPVGAATAANQQTDALTNDELRATPVPVSGTVTSNLGTIAGVATEATLVALPGAIANEELSASVSGSVSTVPAQQGPAFATPIRLTDGTDFLDDKIAAQGRQPVTVLATASGNTPVLSAPDAGNRIVVYSGTVSVNSLDTTAGLRFGASGTIAWAIDSTADELNGSAFDFGEVGYVGGDNEALNVNLSGSGSVRVNITRWSIEEVPA